MNTRFHLTPTGGTAKNRVASIVLAFALASLAVSVTTRVAMTEDYSLGTMASLLAVCAIGAVPLLAYAAILRLLAQWAGQSYLLTAVGEPDAPRTLRPAGGQSRDRTARILAAAAWLVLAFGAARGVWSGIRTGSALQGVTVGNSFVSDAMTLLALSEALRLLRLRTTQRYDSTPGKGPARALRGGALHFPARAGLKRIVCPACGQEQDAARTLCLQCGLDFVFDEDGDDQL